MDLLVRAALLGLAIVPIACGKRAFVPPDPSASASASASVSLSPPSVTVPDLDPKLVATPDPEDPPEPPPPSPLATTCNGVSLVLVAVTPNAGGWVDAVLELRNDSAEHVPLMMTGDGSSSGRRNPTLTFDLTPNQVAPQAGCGNMNAMSADDLVTFAPGTRRRLEWVHAPVPSKPGRYSLRATYKNDPQSKDLGDNMPGGKTDRLVARARKTVPCTLTSNTVSFRWPR